MTTASSTSSNKPPRLPYLPAPSSRRKTTVDDGRDRGYSTMPVQKDKKLKEMFDRHEHYVTQRHWDGLYCVLTVLDGDESSSCAREEAILSNDDDDDAHITTNNSSNNKTKKKDDDDDDSDSSSSGFGGESPQQRCDSPGGESSSSSSGFGSDDDDDDNDGGSNNNSNTTTTTTTNNNNSKNKNNNSSQSAADKVKARMHRARTRSFTSGGDGAHAQPPRQVFVVTRSGAFFRGPHDDQQPVLCVSSDGDDRQRVFRINDQFVSARHLHIEEKNERFYAKDLGSLNGTFFRTRGYVSAHQPGYEHSSLLTTASAAATPEDYAYVVALPSEKLTHANVGSYRLKRGDRVLIGRVELMVTECSQDEIKLYTPKRQQTFTVSATIGATIGKATTCSICLQDNSVRDVHAYISMSYHEKCFLLCDVFPLNDDNDNDTTTTTTTNATTQQQRYALGASVQHFPSTQLQNHNLVVQNGPISIVAAASSRAAFDRYMIRLSAPHQQSDPVVLHSGDVIRIGFTTFVVRICGTPRRSLKNDNNNSSSKSTTTTTTTNKSEKKNTSPDKPKRGVARTPTGGMHTTSPPPPTADGKVDEVPAAITSAVANPKMFLRRRSVAEQLGLDQSGLYRSPLLDLFTAPPSASSITPPPSPPPSPVAANTSTTTTTTTTSVVIVAPEGTSASEVSLPPSPFVARVPVQEFAGPDTPVHKAPMLPPVSMMRRHSERTVQIVPDDSTNASDAMAQVSAQVLLTSSAVDTATGTASIVSTAVATTSTTTTAAATTAAGASASSNAPVSITNKNNNNSVYVSDIGVCLDGNFMHREEMEDRVAVVTDFGGPGNVFLGVYDGHGGRFVGRLVADFVAATLHGNFYDRLLQTRCLPIWGTALPSAQIMSPITSRGDHNRHHHHRHHSHQSQSQSNSISSGMSTLALTSSSLSSTSSSSTTTIVTSQPQPPNTNTPPTMIRSVSEPSIDEQDQRSPRTSFSTVGLPSSVSSTIEQVLSATGVAMRDAFADTTAQCSGLGEVAQYGGTTAVVCFVFKDPASGVTKLLCANTGDSHSIVCRASQALLLTQSHKPDAPTELARITAAGGRVANGRLTGMLTVSRALGDLSMHQFGLSSEPFILEVPLDQEVTHLMLASDGIWDVVSFDDAASLACREENLHASAQNLSDILVDLALTRGSQDNLSCVVAKFTPSPPSSSS